MPDYSALPDDAAAALTHMDGVVKEGRALSVQIAAEKEWKDPAANSKAKKEAAAAAAATAEAAAVQVPAAAAPTTEPTPTAPTTTTTTATTVTRSSSQYDQLNTLITAADEQSVLIWGWPASDDVKKLRVRLRKVQPITSLTSDIASPGPASSVVHVRVASATAARALIRKFHGKAVAGHTLSLRRPADVFPSWKAHKRARLIVRNLAFKVQDVDLLAAFMQHGPVYEARVRTQPDGKAGGFGFITMASREDAVHAMAAVNEQPIHGRKVAVDWCMSKSEYSAAVSAATSAPPADAGSVDGAASDSEAEEASAGQASDAGSVQAEEEAGMSSDGEQAELSDDGEQEEGGSDSAAAPAPAKRVPQHDAGVESGATLFLRNVAFGADEDQIFAAFQPFGQVVYARVVRGPDGASKGKAFVRMAQVCSADAALEGATFGHMPDGEVRRGAWDELEDAQAAKLAAAIDAAKTAGGILLEGRPAIVRRAVDHNQASHLALATSKEVQKRFDKRHLYLAKEGVITKGDPAAELMPAQELARREQAASDMKTRLRSPLFFVSPVRLSVRSLHRSIDDAGLRKLAQQAAEEGLASGLVTRREGDPRLMPAPGVNPDVRVPKSKVFRDVPAKDGARIRLESDGTLRSKGFGFVEFTEHIHALAALRVLNNNPNYAWAAVGGKAAMARPEETRPRLLVAFALENAAKVKLQERRAANAEKKRLALEAAGITPGSAAAPAPAQDDSDAEELDMAGSIAGEEQNSEAAAAAGHWSDSDGDDDDADSVEVLEFGESTAQPGAASAHDPELAAMLREIAAASKHASDDDADGMSDYSDAEEEEDDDDDDVHPEHDTIAASLASMLPSSAPAAAAAAAHAGVDSDDTDALVENWDDASGSDSDGDSVGIVGHASAAGAEEVELPADALAELQKLVRAAAKANPDRGSDQEQGEVEEAEPGPAAPARGKPAASGGRGRKQGGSKPQGKTRPASAAQAKPSASSVGMKRRRVVTATEGMSAKEARQQRFGMSARAKRRAAKKQSESASAAAEIAWMRRS